MRSMKVAGGSGDAPIQGGAEVEEEVIRHRALLERARTYLAEGKRSMARKDLARIMAEDSDYEYLRDMLAQVSG